MNPVNPNRPPSHLPPHAPSSPGQQDDTQAPAGDPAQPTGVSTMSVAQLPAYLPEARPRAAAASVPLPAPTYASVGLHNQYPQAGPADRTPSPPPQRRGLDIFAEWDAWAQIETDASENRAEAVTRMKNWLKAGHSHEELDLFDLGLTSLPENLPASVKSIDVSHNQLTSLSENLPASVKSINVSHNQLTSLSENLPASVKSIDVSHNQLTSLSENLPASLLSLDVSYNQLTRLPENIVTRLGRRCRVELMNNPLPSRVLDHLRQTVSTGYYRGPRFGFSMEAASEGVPARPLENAVSDWYGENEKNDVEAIWSVWKGEEGTAEFSRFLDRLRGTVNYGNQKFRQSVVEWLSHLADHPELRKDTFQVSVGATESCEDRVSLTFNEMKKLRLAADVENGAYDARLPDLISLARGMFRLDKLEEIAREKTESLRFVDEIEVYLAYQVKLLKILNLPLDTPDMRYFSVSWVTEDDLKNAENSVNASENAGFIHYLSTDWQPWQSVLKRLHRSEYEGAQEKLIDAMEDEFTTRLNARLKEIGLENDDDAWRIAGPQLRADMAREINGELTRNFLQTQTLLHLLD
jgi:Leucine-rich repeat (LRR) protein